MTNRVLICGAGIAGLTLAHLLAGRGVEVIAVEHSRVQRRSGNPVDVRGEAMSVADRIGVGDDIRSAATQVTAFEFVNKQGAVIASVRNVSNRGADDVEIPRGDLVAALHDRLPTSVQVLLGDSVAAVRQRDDTVTVELESGRRERVDLLVGADGVHSKVRRLVFGPDERCVRRHGLYVAAAATGIKPDNLGAVQIYNAPRITAVAHPGRGNELALLLFREPADLDVRDRDTTRQAVRRNFTDRGWRSDELAEAVSAADDVYFDAISSVRLDQWSRGRVTLLGDAASSVSLFGEGSSSAMIGAAVLADNLWASDDIVAALHCYESVHRRRVRSRLRGIAVSARLMVPATQFGLTARNIALRAARRS